MDEIVRQIGTYEPLFFHVLQALALLIAGYIVASVVSRFIRRRVTASPHIDQTLGIFFASTVRWLILLIVLIATLELVGIQATSLVAVLGAATLAIGLALQGTLADLAAGVLLIVFRPYRLGDYVDINGTAGTVRDIDLFTTELVTPDNVQIILPNGKAWGSIITNYSTHDTRRLDLNFSIDYDDDTDKATEIILETARADPRVHKEPEPWVRVVNLGESSVNLGVRLWCNAADYWELKFTLTNEIKKAFKKGGITIPYPHRVAVTKAA